MVFTPEGNRLAYTYEFVTIRLWDFAGNAAPIDLSGMIDIVQSVAIDPQRRWIAFGAGPNIQLWSLLDGTPKSITTHYRKSITSLQFSEDGKTLMSAAEGDADAWDVTTLKSKIGLHGNYRFGYCDDIRIGVGNSDGAVRLVDLAGSETRIRVPHSAFGTDRIAVSRDGQTAASASQLGGEVKVWSMADGKAFRTVSRSGYQMYSNLLFSPDEKYVAWGTMNGRVRVLDIASGREIQLCCQGPRFVGAVAFSADSRYVLAAGTGHEIKIWDLSAAWAGRPAEVATLVGHTGTNPLACRHR